MAQQPFRDEREAALARVDDLERELARTKGALDAATRKLARRRKPWTEPIIGGMMGLATLLVLLMGLAMIFGGCAGFTMGDVNPVWR